MNDVIVIGVDHGYAAMKTVHFSFPTGLVEYEHEPYTQKDVLEYGGRYYVVGSGRQPLQRDKTQTEDYYLLTLAAIAKELEHRGAEHTASIHLAAGLPLTSFGRDKKSFRSYLYRDGSAIPFRYEGQDYTGTHATKGTQAFIRRNQKPDTAGSHLVRGGQRQYRALQLDAVLCAQSPFCVLPRDRGISLF